MWLRLRLFFENLGHEDEAAKKKKKAHASERVVACGHRRAIARDRSLKVALMRTRRARVAFCLCNVHRASRL